MTSVTQLKSVNFFNTFEMWKKRGNNILKCDTVTSVPAPITFFGTLVTVSYFQMLFFVIFSCQKYFKRVKELFCDTCHCNVLFFDFGKWPNWNCWNWDIGTLVTVSHSKIFIFPFFHISNAITDYCVTLVTVEGYL